MELEIELVEQQERKLFGLWTRSNDRTLAKDIPALSERYYRAVGKDRGEVFPFFVLSRNYDQQTRDCELFIGGLLPGNGTQSLLLTGGLYAKATVRPKLGFLWGPAIGGTKRLFYTKWLPQSPYRACNLEYERHTEKSVGRAPSIDLYFAVEETAD